jgi:arylsulfatase A-like enzyme
MRSINITHAALVASAIWAVALAEAQEPQRRVILLVFDGLRPDSVTPELTPNISRLAARGVFFTNNHAVYPTTTMMNAAALATGSYPQKAGLWGNIPWTPGASGKSGKGETLDYNQPVDIDDWGNVANLDKFYGGRLLLVPTLFGEAQRRGLKTYTSGKSDPAFLFDLKQGGMMVDEHTVFPRPLADELLAAGARLPKNIVMWPDLKLPATNGDPMARKPKVLMADGQTSDPSRTDATPFVGSYSYLTEMLTTHILPKKKPNLSMFWIRDPDTTEHWYGPGSGPYVDALKQADARVGQIVAALAAENQLDTTDIVLVSDHGHSSVSGDQTLFPARSIADGRLGAPDPARGYSVSGEVRLAQLLLDNKVAANIYDGQGKIFDPVLSGVLADGRQVYPDQRGGETNFTSDGEMVPDLSRLPPEAVVVASNPCNEYIYLPKHDAKTAAAIVRFLQSREEFGAIFVADSYDIPGTVKLSRVWLNDPERRHPDIVVAYNDDPEAVVQGIKGTTYTGQWLRRGDHGTPGRVNIHNTLIAAGPDFKSGLRSEIPSGNVDVAPTIAFLLGFELPDVDGRVLHEGLSRTNIVVRASPPTRAESTVAAGLTMYRPTASRNENAQVAARDASYRVQITMSSVTDSVGRRSWVYLDDARAIRIGFPVYPQ